MRNPVTTAVWRRSVPALALAASLLAASLLAALAGLRPVPHAEAARGDYVGAAACGRCHPEAYASWQASAHARADELLGEDASAACLSCHTTGEAPAGPVFFGGVSCESCHGPGAAYARDDVMRNPHLARLLGLRDLSTAAARDALCAACHEAQTRLRPFDAASAYRRIEHR
ncbi:multiheme c-type cytochrome [Haliangium ochraceum]|uniref:Cytochrome c-552/4 domain-containing protein n=1 Tax=Haliangium ochraceum (strain DSM 14365 / JCM 11303 / SMP-2) TaxID=502025 RepID=D0LG48_HALO1|nr:multiheme c-type cytochrome [Haliangium ochraceum]ACY18073.1 conserved hypothetical protein [Haliangium ochraceum DSM 14365]